MIYSVWNQAKQAFDYYQTNGVQKQVNTEKPSHLRSRKLGLTVNEAAWPVPSGAQLIGSGIMPRGRVGSFKRGMKGLGAFESNTMNMLLLATAGVALYKAFK